MQSFHILDSMITSIIPLINSLSNSFHIIVNDLPKSWLQQSKTSLNKTSSLLMGPVEALLRFRQITSGHWRDNVVPTRVRFVSGYKEWVKLPRLHPCLHFAHIPCKRIMGWPWPLALQIVDQQFCVTYNLVKNYKKIIHICLYHCIN